MWTFFPLTVDYREQNYAAGKIPGGFFKREGRPTEKETLTSRMIDRPLRPLFPDGYRCETQVIAYLLSADLVNDSDTLAITGASTALCLSDIPFSTPVAALRVGYWDEELRLNPSSADLRERSKLNLLVAGERRGHRDGRVDGRRDFREDDGGRSSDGATRRSRAS